MRNKFRSISYSNFVLISLGFIFVYLILRGLYVPLVHDEAATFFHYIITGNFIPPQAHWDANNHILNSALTYLSYSLFGTSEIALRLPNILTFLLFFFFTYKISTEISNKILQVVFILSLVFAHNFIEFFALTRGYGMSMAFLFASIWYLLEVLKYNRLKDYSLSLVFMSLAILANLTLMNTAIIITAILCSNVLLNFKKYKLAHTLKAFGIIIIIGLIPIMVLVWVLLEFKKRGSLYYGTLDGFWELTVKSLTKLLTGSESLFPSLLAMLYFIFAIVLFIYLLIKSKSLKSLWNSYNLFFVLLVGNFIAVFILGNFLGINFPEDRTGLYFFPFSIGTFIFLLDKASILISRKVLLLIVAPFVFFPIHFLFSLNLTHSSLWIDERIPKDFYSKVIDDSNQINKPYSIGGYHMRTLCWAYLNYTNDGVLNQIQNSHYPEYVSDYQVVEVKDTERWDELYEKKAFDPISKLSLLKRKNFLSSKTLDRVFIQSSGEIIEEYYNLYVGKIDTLSGKTLSFEISMTLDSDEHPFVAWVIAQVKDKDNKSLEYEFIALNWKRPYWNEKNGNFRGSVIIYDLPEDSKEMVLYIWNINKKPFIAESINCSINEILIE